MKKCTARAAALMLALLMLAAALCGCGSRQASANVMMTSSYVFIDQYEAYGATISEKLPAFNTDTEEIKYLSFSTGGGMPSMQGTKIDAMLGAAEIDVLICDLPTAIRYGENGAMYEDLSKFFTAEELAAMKYSIISFPVLDDNGAETGEMTAPVAIDITGHPIIKDMVMEENSYILVPVSAYAKDAAREIIKIITAE